MPAPLTDPAQRALQHASEVTSALHSTYIGTEHLLLGLLKDPESKSAKALAACGMTYEAALQSITDIFGPTSGGISTTTPAPTSRVRNIISLAEKDAKENGTGTIDTDNLLLAILVENEGVAAKLLVDKQITLKRIQDILNPKLVSAGGVEERPVRKTPYLTEYGRDLTKEALAGTLSPMIGRDRELERVLQVLSRRTKSNPALLGEAGVGKTALAEGLAYAIVEGNVPDDFLGKRLISIAVGDLLAGCKYRGEFEERVKKLIEEATAGNDIILFIDELHTLVSAGAANMLKPALARREIKVIGASTLKEYRKYIEKDGALDRRFQPVYMEAPTVEETIEILRGIRRLDEAHHNVKISDEALIAAAKLSDLYIRDHQLPDKAIDLVDEASARVRMLHNAFPAELVAMATQLEALGRDRRFAADAKDYVAAKAIREQEDEIRPKFVELRAAWQESISKEVLPVDAKDIAALIAARTKRPVGELLEDEATSLLHLEDKIHERLIGQDEAVKAVSRAIRRSRAGLKSNKQPVGSFLFLGPTGVGKTELARCLADVVFHNPDCMVRLDMSEFMERHSTARLVGSPPGYVGSEEGGQLTEVIRRQPFSIVLFDEIEKAHPEVFNLLLQILDAGRLSDAHGREVDFSHSIVIMTSNLGSNELKSRPVGFRSNLDNQENSTREQTELHDKATGAAKKAFLPELLNRIDAMIPFDRLTREQMVKITSNMLTDVARRVADQELILAVSPKAQEKLATDGYDQTYGARPLRRLIQSEVDDRLTDLLLGKNGPKPSAGSTLTIDVEEGGEIVVHVEPPALPENTLVTPELAEPVPAGREL